MTCQKSRHRVANSYSLPVGARALLACAAIFVSSVSSNAEAPDRDGAPSILKGQGSLGGEQRSDFIVNENSLRQGLLRYSDADMARNYPGSRAFSLGGMSGGRYASVSVPFAALQSMWLKTSIGSRICNEILGGETLIMQMHLGLSVSYSGRDLCGRKYSVGSSLSKNWILDRRVNTGSVALGKSLVGGSEHDSFDRRSFAIFISPVPPPFSGWTTAKQPKSVFAFSESEIREPGSVSAALLRRLIHEDAVYFDGEFALSEEQKRTLSQPEVAVILDDPLIVNSFAALRAFQVENLAMFEISDAVGEILKDETVSLPDLRNEEQVLRYVENISLNFRSLAIHLLVGMHESRSLQSTDLVGIGASDLHEYSQIVDARGLTFGTILNFLVTIQNESGRTENLIQYLTRPGLVGNGMSRAQGPRPNVGNGTGRRSGSGD